LTGSFQPILHKNVRQYTKYCRTFVVLSERNITLSKLLSTMKKIGFFLEARQSLTGIMDIYGLML